MSETIVPNTGPAPQRTDPELVTPDQVLDALDRLKASASFRGAPQLSAFLTFIVRATLGGKAHEIKGYTIAVEALGRPTDFDPVADPIVRVEAGRLRRAIEAYYARDGAADPVRIGVPRGSYVPVFERVPCLDEAARSSLVSGPVVPKAVVADAAGRVGDSLDPAADPTNALPRSAPTDTTAVPRPFGAHGPIWLAIAATFLAVAIGIGSYVWRPDPSGALAGGVGSLEPMTSAGRRQPTIQVKFLPGVDEQINEAGRQYDQQLSDALSRFDDFMVLKASAGPVAGPLIQPTYRIEFSADPVGSDRIVTALRLFDVANGRVVFSAGEEFPRLALFNMEQIREVARVNAVRIAQPYGRIYSDLRLNGIGGPPVQCIVRTYDYWSSPSAERHAEVRDCLEFTVRSDPNYHPAWALLAMIHLDEYRIGYNPRPGSALDRARKASQQAVALAPESARALQSLMAVLTVSGETSEALRVGFEAVRRNPFDTDILADLGARLTQAGRAREGRPLLLRAAEVNRARPIWHEFYLYLSAREVGDTEGARSALKALELAEAPLALLARALAAADAGRYEDALAAMRNLARISPIFSRDAGEFLDRAFFAPEVRAMLLDGLNRGGLALIGKT